MEHTPEDLRRRDLLVRRGERRRQQRERATITTRSTLLRTPTHRDRDR